MNTIIGEHAGGRRVRKDRLAPLGFTLVTARGFIDTCKAAVRIIVLMHHMPTLQTPVHA